jgi:DNA-binding MarR family transcriptional regulator
MIERFERFSLVISEISSHWHKITSDEMEKYGLKGAHAMYLTTLQRYEDGLTATQLCELCGKDKSDVSRMMGIMEKKGLVIKEGINQNMYRGVFRLTEAGKEAAAFVRRRASLAVQLAGSEMTEEKRAVMYEALEMIEKKLSEISREGLPKE